jgi:hypothetical protein
MEQATFERDRAMSGGRSSCSEVDRFVFGYGREVAVIPEGDQGLAHGRIDETVGEAGSCQCHSYHLGEALADEKEATAPGMQPGDLGVLPKPAGLHVQAVQLSGDGLSGRFQGLGGPHDDADSGAERVYLRSGDSPVVDGLATRDTSATDGSGHHESFQVDPVVTVPV